MMELAKMVGDIATGVEPNEQPVVDARAVRRGKARAEKLSPARRKKIAKKAAAARWKGRK